jgi:ATP-dependent DNA ligase
LNESNYLKCLPLIISSLHDEKEKLKALDQITNIQNFKNSDDWMMFLKAIKWEKPLDPSVTFKLLKKLNKSTSPTTVISGASQQGSQIAFADWNPAAGIMKYKELRPREVEANPGKMLKPYVGYYVSTKYDGWQVLWNGKNRTLTSHTGSVVFDAPEWWVKFLPNQYFIAGELIIPGKQAAKVSSLRNKSNPDWATALFMVFDILGTVSVPFEKRTEKLQKIVQKACSGSPQCPLRYVEQVKLDSVQAIFKYYKDVVYDHGGQGIVLTRPTGFYVPGGKRTADRVKLKRREDTEGRVVGYNMNGPVLKSLLVVMDNGIEFSLGIGFTQEERANYLKHFPLGTLVKFSYRELTDSGAPKQARFVQHRLDV